MYGSKRSSPSRDSELDRLHREERRQKNEDLLLNAGPVDIIPSELKNIQVEIRGISSRDADTPPPLQHDLGDPSQFVIRRRPGEGSKPIFHSVIVNLPHDNRRVSVRHEREHVSRNKSSPGRCFKKSSPDRSRSPSLKRSRLSRSLSPQILSSHRLDDSKRNRRLHSPGRASNSRRSPKRIESPHRESSVRRSSRTSPSRHSSPRRSPTRRGSPRRTNSPRRSPRRSSPRRSPNRRGSPSRRSSPGRTTRGSPSRRDYDRDRERDRYRSHHESERSRDYRRSSAERRSVSRRHHSPSRSEVPCVTVPVDPVYHGYYQLPIPPEYWLGIPPGMMQPGMFPRPRPPPGFVPRPGMQFRPTRFRPPFQARAPNSSTTTTQNKPIMPP